MIWVCDVPSGKILAAIQEFKPDIVGFRADQRCLQGDAGDDSLSKGCRPQSFSPRAYLIGAG